MYTEIIFAAVISAIRGAVKNPEKRARLKPLVLDLIRALLDVYPEVLNEKVGA
jgi:hypothetical protein